MKISILYASVTGNTERAAEMIKDGMLLAHPMLEVKCMNIINESEIDEEFLKESVGVVFGTPTYYASMCWQLKKFFDTTKYPLMDKLGGAFATENFIQGGADIAISSALDHMLVKGMVIYSSGGAFGKPIIHLGPVAIGTKLQESEEIFNEYGKRFAKKCVDLFA